MVYRFSAQLYIPTEQRVPVEQSHSNMVKFSSAEDRTYRTVVRYLKEWVDSITESNGTEQSFQNAGCSSRMLMPTVQRQQKFKTFDVCASS